MSLMMICRVGLLSAVGQLMVVLAGLSSAPAPTAAPLPCYVPVAGVRVVDADTIHVDDIEFPWGVSLRNQRVRANDYDAWELSRRRRSVVITDEEIERGHKAAGELRILLAQARAVYLSPGPEDRDHYGRILASITVIDGKGKTVHLAAWMNERGHCRPDTDAP